MVDCPPVTGSSSERGAEHLRERGTALLEEAAERSRPRSVADRVRANGHWVIQAALATAMAWTLAKVLFGHERPIFAPVVALVGVSAALGGRRRYTVEMTVGVALGIGIADVFIGLVGDGVVQIAVVVGGAMLAAIALCGSTVLVSEAATSALLVVTVQQPGTGLSGARFLDSLLGALVALAVASLLPANPVHSARRAVAPLLSELSGALEDIARALAHRDEELAQRTLERVRGLDPDAFEQAVLGGRETLRLAPFGGKMRRHFARYVETSAQIHSALTSVETLSRAALRALQLSENAPPPVYEAVRDLASAVRRLDESLDDPYGRTLVREPALRAAARATLAFEQTGNLSVSVIVVQVRNAAVDLLRGSGLAADDAERLVREAAASLISAPAAP